MSTTTAARRTAHAGTGAQAPTAEELAAMTPEEAMLAGAEADGVHIVHRRDRFPIRGTKAEKRAERGVAACFMIAALAGVGFIVALRAPCPWHWHLPGTPQNFRFYTPALGGLLAALLLFMGVGMVLWAKWLMPEEEVDPGPPRRPVHRGRQADDRGDAGRRPRGHRPAAPLADPAHRSAWPAARSPPCRSSPSSAP